MLLTSGPPLTQYGSLSQHFSFDQVTVCMKILIGFSGAPNACERGPVDRSDFSLISAFTNCARDASGLALIGARSPPASPPPAGVSAVVGTVAQLATLTCLSAKARYMTVLQAHRFEPFLLVHLS